MISMLQRLSRPSRLCVPVLAALALVVGVWTAAPASAFTGAVPDGRPATPLGEITAQYWHGLNRDPDPAGLANYMSFVNQDCRWGILDGSFKILNSAEAHNVWRNDPQTLAGMLYAALLNRPPDAGGLATYTAAIQNRGLPWATASMEASPEYNARLSAICGTKTTATMYTWTAAQAFAKYVLLPRVKALSTACIFNTSVKTALGQLDQSDNFLLDSIGIVAETASTLEDLFGLDGTCGSAAQYLRTMLNIGQVINGSQYNPVFIEFYVGNPAVISRQRLWIVRVGPNPTSWTAYSGHAW